MPYHPIRPRRLAVDIGATKLALRAEAPGVAWVDRQDWAVRHEPATTPDRVRVQYPPAPSEPSRPAGTTSATMDAEQLVAALAGARHRLGGRVDRVAVACAPTLDPAGRVTAWPSRPSWVGLPLHRLVTDATGAREVVFGDDGTFGALAEAAAAGCGDLVYFGLGTGIGGGIVSGGRLLTGRDGGAGEIGHLPVDPRGPGCACGRDGCLQAFASGPALARRATAVRGRVTTTAELVSAVRTGLPWALRIQAMAAEALAAAVVAIDELLRPSRVHIGGGLGHALGDLPGLVAAGLEHRQRAGRTAPAVVAASGAGDESLAGALLVARGLDPRAAVRAGRRP